MAKPKRTKRSPRQPAKPTFLSKVGEALLKAAPTALRVAVPLVAALAAVWGFLRLTDGYLQGSETFLVDPRNIAITGCTADVTEQFVRKTMLEGVFGLTEPENGFGLVRAKIVERLRQSPYFSAAEMTYRPGRGTVELHVREREPVARLRGTPLVVDAEGMCFPPLPNTPGALPTVAGWDVMRDYEPGTRMPAKYRCMLRLIAAAATGPTPLPSAVRDVDLLPNAYDVDDGLSVRLADGREVIIAWPGMGMDVGRAGEEARGREREAMLGRLRRVALALGNPDLAGKRRVNALTGEIAVSD